MASWASIAKVKAAKQASGNNSLAITAAKDGLRLLVVDANAIIDGLRLEGIADQAATIQEVLDEIRDKQARQFMASLPYELQVAEPSEESLKAGEQLLLVWWWEWQQRHTCHSVTSSDCLNDTVTLPSIWLMTAKHTHCWAGWH